MTTMKKTELRSLKVPYQPVQRAEGNDAPVETTDPVECDDDSTLGRQRRLQRDVLRHRLITESHACSDEDSRLQTEISVFKYLGLPLLAIFTLGFVAVVMYAAQQIANKSHIIVFGALVQIAVLVLVYLQIAVLVLVLGTICLFTLPANFCILKPFVDKYQETGVQISGEVIHRYYVEQQRQDRRRRSKPKHYYHLVVLYKAVVDDNEEAYSKEFDVELSEFQQKNITLLYIPDIPTSAVLPRMVDGQWCGSDTMLAFAACCFFAIPMFAALVLVAHVTDVPDVATLVMLLLLLLGSAFCATMGTLQRKQKWLYGTARRLPSHLFSDWLNNHDLCLEEGQEEGRAGQTIV